MTVAGGGIITLIFDLLSLSRHRQVGTYRYHDYSLKLIPKPIPTDQGTKTRTLPSIQHIPIPTITLPSIGTLYTPSTNTPKLPTINHIPIPKSLLVGLSYLTNFRRGTRERRADQKVIASDWGDQLGKKLSQTNKQKVQNLNYKWIRSDTAQQRMHSLAKKLMLVERSFQQVNLRQILLFLFITYLNWWQMGNCDQTSTVLTGKLPIVEHS